MRYDAVVIGAGLGGLSAAAYLANKGKSVLVLEKSLHIGGYATSFDHRNLNYEVSLHSIGDLDNYGSLNKILNDISFFDQCRFIKANSLYSIVEGKKIIEVTDLKSFISSLKRKYPNYKKAIELVVKTFVRLRKEIDDLNFSRPEESIWDKAPTMIRYKNYTLDDFYAENKINRCIANEFSRYWMYFGLSAKDLSFVFYAYVWTEYFLHGAFYPEFRSSDITTAFANIIKINGGKIATRNSAKRIILESGKVTSVLARKGQVIKTKNVVADIDPRVLFSTMVDSFALPSRYSKKIKRITPSKSSFLMYLHLKEDFVKKFKTKSHELFFDNDISDNPINFIDKNDVRNMPFSMTIYENINHKYQNNINGATVSVFTLANFDYWSNFNYKDYIDEKKRWAQILLERIEEVFNGFTSCIDSIVTASPLTNKKYTGNLHGEIYGSAQIVSQSLNKRLDHKTPIEGLWLSGSWTKPGGGYSGSIWSGYQTCKEILKEDKL